MKIKTELKIFSEEIAPLHRLFTFFQCTQYIAFSILYEYKSEIHALRNKIQLFR